MISEKTRGCAEWLHDRLQVIIHLFQGIALRMRGGSFWQSPSDHVGESEEMAKMVPNEDSKNKRLSIMRARGEMLKSD
jgi:hypothetical protein